jgi:hypothetical protein
VTSSHHHHSHDHDQEAADQKAADDLQVKQSQELRNDIERLRLFLIAHFGDVTEPLLEEVEGREEELLVMTVKVDAQEAKIDLMTMVRRLNEGDTSTSPSPTNVSNIHTDRLLSKRQPSPASRVCLGAGFQYHHLVISIVHRPG